MDQGEIEHNFPSDNKLNNHFDAIIPGSNLYSFQFINSLEQRRQ